MEPVPIAALQRRTSTLDFNPAAGPFGNFRGCYLVVMLPFDTPASPSSHRTQRIVEVLTMVSHVSDSSFHPEAHDTGKDSLADQVLAKLQDESLTSAFNFMKSSVQNVYSGRDEDQDGKIDLRDRRDDVPMNDKEKQEFWTSLSKELEEKRPGVLNNLSAVWLKDFKTTELKTMPFEADYVQQIAANGKQMNKTFAGEALKDLPNIKALSRADDIIDDIELDKNIQRQKQIPRDQFVKDIIGKAVTDSETSPIKAVDAMYQALKVRGQTETQAERAASYAAVAEALKDYPDLASKMSMGYVQRNFKDIDTNYGEHKENFRISKEELSDFTPDSIGKVFINYVKANFDSIASTSTYDKYLNSQNLTADELNNLRAAYTTLASDLEAKIALLAERFIVLLDLFNFFFKNFDIKLAAFDLFL